MFEEEVHKPIIGEGTTVYNPHKSVILQCKIGKMCKIHSPVWIGNNVVIGDGCMVQAFAFLPEGVHLGEKVFVGPHVCFTNDKHPPSDNWLDTYVEDCASIGAGCVILPGVRIGRGSKIGAGSVVTKDVPDFTTVLGNPARIVSQGTPFSP